MKKLILTATILSIAFGTVHPARAGRFGTGIAIGAAVGFVTGAALTAAACDTPRYYPPPVAYAPACAPAGVVYAPPPVAYVPAPSPVMFYQPAVVAVPAPVVSAPVLYGPPGYRPIRYHRFAYRAAW